ncbi:hypothetical protein PAL_GLEAN10024559 [Pteropus alecto]|uniref:Uncharacterized protein n=1 Tax=Pteropus alecto TaxID=9402 RepID=L5JZ30_PTEAL|nr:hypothetical protein PAL_GLEAN10024559 [Pteropus alecto]
MRPVGGGDPCRADLGTEDKQSPHPRPWLSLRPDSTHAEQATNPSSQGAVSEVTIAVPDA